MDASSVPGHHLANGYRCHGAPFHPLHLYDAGHPLLPELGYTCVQGVQQLSPHDIAATPASKTYHNVNDYSNSDQFQEVGGHRSFGGNTYANAGITAPVVNCDGFEQRRFGRNSYANTAITAPVVNYDGSDHRRFGGNSYANAGITAPVINCEITAPVVNCDGSDHWRFGGNSYANAGITASVVNYDGSDHWRFGRNNYANAGITAPVVNCDGSDHRRFGGNSYGNAGITAPVVNCDGSVQFQVLRGHRYFHGNTNTYANAGITLNVNGAGFDPNGEPLTVWRDNCAQVFERIVGKLRQPRHHLYIALDLEYVADASTDIRRRPISWIDWYEHLHTFVNGGEMVQVGLALAFELEEHHHGGSVPIISLEINLEFDKDARGYNGASVTFLERQGHRLAEHRDHGVTAEKLLDGLLCHLPFGDDSVTWVTYHGDRDFGFLLRLLHRGPGGGSGGGGGGALPPDRAAFMRQVRRQFPVFYDVRVLGQLVKEGFRGKLTALAEHLGVRRTGGEHHAGSDALLTLSCFLEILRLSAHELHRLHSRQCLLSGMEELDMGIKCARHIDDVSVITVEVRGCNFDKEARLIEELVTSNFKIVGVDVLLPLLSSGSRLCAADDQQYYNHIKCRLEGIDAFEVTIGFMNAEGMLAYGRVWKFCISFSANLAVVGDNNCYVHPWRLGWLMARCGATHNPNVAWVTYQGSDGIACLIKSFIAADDLPSHWCSYIEYQRGVFPTLYDVGLIAQRCPDIVMYPLEMLLAPQALLVLRCYKRLAERPPFPLIAASVRGQLMASQSWYCPTTR